MGRRKVDEKDKKYPQSMSMGLWDIFVLDLLASEEAKKDKSKPKNISRGVRKAVDAAVSEYKDETGITYTQLNSKFETWKKNSKFGV